MFFVKVLIQLVLILFLCLFLIIRFLLPNIEQTLFSDQFAQLISYDSGGTIELVYQEFLPMPTEEYQAHLVELRQRFGFDVQMVPKQDMSPLAQEKLDQSGEFIDTESVSIYRLLPDGERVLGFVYLEKASPNVISNAQWRSQGVLFTIQRILRQLPESEWGAKLYQLSHYFDFNLRLVDISSVSLDERQTRYLSTGKIAWIEHEDSEFYDTYFDYAYLRVSPDSNKVIKIGSYTEKFLEAAYPMLYSMWLLIAVFCVLPVILWLYPTWKSIRNLDKAAAQFEHGDFTARANEVFGSNSNNFVRGFNQMANRIESLILMNKSLVNSVSHELRTPLSRIEFDLELARSSRLKPEEHAALDRIEKSSQDINDMVGEMLTYAKFEREVPTTSFVPVNISTWLDKEQLTWPPSSEKIKVIVQNSDPSVSWHIDKYYLGRAISNLVSNAMKYAQSTVQITISKTDEGLAICVDDDGTGVDISYREQVFEPFFRLDSSRSRDSGGAGLGLAIVKQIVVWHKGVVRVEDSKLGGARFKICLNKEAA